MNALLLICFLLACLIGAVAAWRLRLDDISGLAPLFLLPPAIIAVTLTIAAEVSSPVARYLSLVAVILASASYCGGAIAARRSAKAGQAAERL
jgi:H+-translocating NAD(P) transhydrogenase subunit alpha